MDDFVLHLSRNYGYHRSYINMMDRRSCRVLLDAVYEPHYAHYKEDFGKTIAGFFSDEPELGNGHLYDMNDAFGGPQDYPWSQELEEELHRKLGDEYDIHLSLLWENNADPTETANLRCTFMDTVSRLVQQDFSEQIGGWCRAHNVEYIGHLIEGDNHHTRTGSSLGHYFRGLSGQDMAGIDVIGGQVYPQGEDISYNRQIFDHRDGPSLHYMLGKLADSAGAIEPRKRGRAMCEIFGNYGWSEGVRLEKYLVDHFLVRGINHFVPHAFSPRPYPDPDCPPHFYAWGNNPQYRHFGCLMAYTNRVCELMNGGRHIAPVAVLYHAEADWTGQCMTGDRVGHLLADAQIDYDYLPQDVFAERQRYRTVIAGGRLHVNTQSYRVFVVPSCQFLTGIMASAIEELTAAGIPVYYINESPNGICVGSGTVPHAQCVPLETLVDTLRNEEIPELQIVPANDRIRCRHYVHGDGTDVFFLVNEGTDVWEGTLTLPACPGKTAYEYDPWKNGLEALFVTVNKLCLKIEPLHSRTIILDPTVLVKDIFPIAKEAPEEWRDLPFSGFWLRELCRSIDYPAFSQPKVVVLPDALAQEKPQFSGFVRYRNSFEAHVEDQIQLEITDAHEAVEVFLNNSSCGIQIVPPFRFDLSGGLLDGKNELSIEVATTLERENSGTRDQFDRSREAKALSGITGRIRLWKAAVK